MRYLAWLVCSAPWLSSHVGFALYTFCSVCSSLRNLEASPSSSIALEPPCSLVHTQKCGWKKVDRSCRSISTGNQVSGQASRIHTGGRGTVLEKGSGKYRSITIEPVDCHSYKILQSRVHRFAWFGAGKAESFFLELIFGCRRIWLYFLLMLESQKCIFQRQIRTTCM